MAITEGSEMVTGLIGIPVTSCGETSHGHAFLQTRLATPVFVQVESVFTGPETGEVRFDHQPFIAVQSRHGADALADSLFTDPVEADHFGLNGNGIPRDRERKGDKTCQQPLHDIRTGESDAF